MSLKFDSARNKMVNENRKKAGLTVYETPDRPKNAGRYTGSGLSDVEIANLQNDTDWLERNGYNNIKTDDVDNDTVEPLDEENTDDDSTNEKSDLANSMKDSISIAMQDFNEVLIKLDNKFCKHRAIYTMYFKMTLGNETTLVDTTSTEWTENVLISFTHKMNGSGQANTFTLELLFKPNDRNIITIKSLENKLLANCIVYKSKDELKDIESIYNNCNFQYGYGDDSSLRSPMYNGSIMDYDCKLENGNLRYTITGYCGLYSAKEYRISPKTDYLTDKDGKEIDNALDYIARIFEVEFADTNYYDMKFINIPDTSKVKYPGNDYKQFNQKNIFSVISDILSGCMTEDQYNAMSGGEDESETKKAFLPNQKQLFGYYISDTSNTAKYGTVYIYKLESLYGEENKDKTENTITADCNITFSWFAPTSGAYNHIVKEWNPKYEGSVLFALATTYISGKDTYYTMTDNGEMKAVTGLGAARLGVNDSDTNRMILSTIQEYDNWSFVTQYPYNASMTLLGCPCEVPMTGKIKVIAKMGNENHHSSGVYMILGKTDKISSGGFFSEFELFKFAPGYDPSYTEIPNDEEKEKEEEETVVKKEIEEKPYYQTIPNYSRDAVESDVKSNFGKSQYNNWFVGKDGKLYLKSLPYQMAIDVDTTISASPKK